ncbi:MAG: MarR family transcriptional regulator [Alphaproteobacteria bacterium]
MTTKPRTESATEPRTLSLIKQVQYAAYVRLERALEPLGVTALQFRILSTLEHREKLSSADLARAYNVKPQTMIKQIILLESKKLIRRRTGAANKRVLEVEMTARGRDLLRACAENGDELEAELLEPFSVGERALYRELLTKVLDRLDDMDATPDVAPLAMEGSDLLSEGTRPGVQRVTKPAH